MLTSLDVKAAIATEGAVTILETSCRHGTKAVSARQHLATARRRSHALD
jgi:hypothetical protein